MNLAIWGTKSEAVYLAKQISKNSGYNICFIDNNKVKANLEKYGGGVIYPHQILDMDKKLDAVIVAVRGTQSRLDIIRQLREMKIKRIGVFRFSAHDYNKNICMDKQGNSEYIIWLDQIHKPVIPYLETHIMDSCNLNCKGCTHFSNLYEKESKVFLKQFKNDIKQLAKKCFVIQLRLLGGEPLLNQECAEYFVNARKAFPHTDINIVTNGVLIVKQNAQFFQSMRQNQIGFHISKYPPTMKIKDLIEEKCRKEKVDYFFERNIITEFARHLSMTGNSDTEASQSVCISRGCRFLRNGKLYKCPTEGLIDKFAVEYHYTSVLSESKGFDIYDDTINWEQKLADYHNLPVAVCRYCSEKRENFEWKIQNQPQEADWLTV